MWPFRKNKFKKLKQEDVVTSIIELTRREEEMEQTIVENQGKIRELFSKGKAEKDPNIRTLLAKKINFLKDDNKNLVQRSMYLMYNIKLLNRLKDALDDDNFIASVGEQNLSDLLGVQKQLALFLNRALNRKVKAENILTGADDIFNEVASSYEPDDRIYGITDSDDETLAMFELEDNLELDGAGETESKPLTPAEPAKEKM